MFIWEFFIPPHWNASILLALGILLGNFHPGHQIHTPDRKVRTAVCYAQQIVPSAVRHDIVGTHGILLHPDRNKPLQTVIAVELVTDLRFF